MRNMLAFLAAVVLTIGGLGWYLDWYKVRSETLPSGHHNVNIEIDTAKLAKDLQKGEEKIHDLLEKQSKEKSASTGAAEESEKTDKAEKNAGAKR
jgi:hypothetical protein